MGTDIAVLCGRTGVLSVSGRQKLVCVVVTDKQVNKDWCV